MKHYLPRFFVLGNLLLIASIMARASSDNLPFYFPQPTGPYAVGLRRYYWVDQSRKEVGSSLFGFRRLQLLVWYPADQKACSLVERYHPAFWDFDKKNNNKISMLSHNHRPIFAHYQNNASLAENARPFPLLIFSHGWGNLAELYTAYCTELASHGYIVFSINHTRDCAFVDFPQNVRVTMAPEFDKMSDEDLDAFMDQHIMVWIRDTQFVLDVIAQENENPASMFYQKLDCARVGLLGHSYGGATAFRCCQLDGRFSACCNLDGDLYGTSPSSRFEKPSLLVRGQMTKCTAISRTKKAQRFQRKFGKRCMPGVYNYEDQPCSTYVVDIPQASHASFTDRPILRHARATYFSDASGVCVEDGFELTHNINMIVRAFFDKHLKGIACDELEWCKAGGLERQKE